MKKFYLLFLSLCSLTVFGQTTFNGNGRTGFGGTVGNSTLTISDDGTNLTFSFTKGAGDFNDAVVIYIDSKSGGFTSTASFTDHGDGLRTAISGTNGTDVSVLTFPSGFEPEYVIAFDKGFEGRWALVSGASHTYLAGEALSGNATDANFTFAVPKSELEIGTGGFDFLATYTSETAWRSNEFIGDPGPVANPGNTDYTATGYYVLPVTITGFTAVKNNNSIGIRWAASQEMNIDYYDVLRSADGTHFAKIGSVNATGSPLYQTYSYTDRSPVQGNNFYKLSVVSKDGKTHYSETVAANFTSNNQFKAYTTASHNVLKLRLQTNAKGKYDVEIMNSFGQQIFRSKLVHNGNAHTYSIQLNHPLPVGIYSVSVAGQHQKFNKLIMIK